MCLLPKTLSKIIDIDGRFYNNKQCLHDPVNGSIKKYFVLTLRFFVNYRLRGLWGWGFCSTNTSGSIGRGWDSCYDQ